MRSQSSHRHDEEAAEKATQTVLRIQQVATDTATLSSDAAQPMNPDRAESEFGVSIRNKKRYSGSNERRQTILAAFRDGSTRG